MTNKHKISDSVDDYVIEVITKHDAVSYERIKKADKKNGVEVDIKW